MSVYQRALEKLLQKNKNDIKIQENLKKYLNFSNLSQEEQNILEKEIKLFLINKIFDEKYLSKKFFLEINSGAGGNDAQNWAEMILEMYIKYFTKNTIKFNIIDQNKDNYGIKNCLLEINDFAYKYLGEVGIHRLVRISPFNAQNKRHTSFAAVHIYPIIEQKQITINEKDLRIDTFRSSGAGGQHVNKTDSGVRITYLPKNIVTQCQNERSQLQNKQIALQMLEAKLRILEEESAFKEKNSLNKISIEWGNQFRSYVLYPYKAIKDTRINKEIKSDVVVLRFLSGEIQQFLDFFIDFAITSL